MGSPPPVLRACALCYARKVKCVMTDDQCCRACKENKVECRQRETRKYGRPRGQGKHSFRTTMGSISEPSDSSIFSTDPNTNSRRDSSGTSASSFQGDTNDLSATNNFRPGSSEFSFQTNTSVMYPPFIEQDGHVATLQHAMQSPEPLPFPETPEDLQLMGSTPSMSLACNGENVFPSPAQTVCEPMGNELPYVSWNQFSYPSGSLLEEESGEARAGSSLFDSYLEIERTLKRISAGAYVVMTQDVTDDGSVMRQIKQVVEAADSAIGNGTGAGVRNIIRLAILTTRKACELAEHCVRFIAACLEGCAPAERVAAMIRVDKQLAMLNGVVCKYASWDQNHSSAETAAITHLQHLLLQIHMRIRCDIDSMLPKWSVS